MLSSDSDTDWCAPHHDTGHDHRPGAEPHPVLDSDGNHRSHRPPGPAPTDSTQGANSYASTTVRPNSGTAWYPSAPYPTTRGPTRVAFKYYERVRHFDRPDLFNTGNTRTSGWALITPERHSASLKLEITRHQRLR